MEVTGQVLTFIMTIMTGILLGAIFDCYRVLRSTFNPQAFMTWLTDLLYWLIATTVVFVSLVLSNWGELRFYVFIGIIGGLCLYYKLLSIWAIRLFINVLRFLIMLLRFLKKIISIVILRPCGYCLKILLWPFKFIFYKIIVWQRAWRKKPVDEEEKK